MKESLLTGMEWSPAWGVGVQPHHLANVQLDQNLGGGQHLRILGTMVSSTMALVMGSTSRSLASTLPDPR